MSLTNESIRLFRRPAYSFLILAILMQVVDFLIASRPMQLGVTTWRFQIMIGASSTVGSYLLLLFLAQLVAYLCADVRAVSLIGTLSMLAAVILLFCAVSFSFDAVRVRHSIDRQLIGKFDIATIQTAFRFLASATVCLLYAIHASRARTHFRLDRQRTSGAFAIDDSVVHPGS